MPVKDSDDQLGAHAAVEDEAPPAADEAPAAEDEVPAAAGDLVQLHDGAFAVVVSIDPTTVLRLGVPERHEVPFARKVR